MELSPSQPMLGAASERELIGVALSLGAQRVRGWSDAEQAVAAQGVSASDALVERAYAGILHGDDPLGEAFGVLRSAAERRPLGATYTPAPIVSAMTNWAASRNPVRIVDPGAGTGRFVVAAGRRFPSVELVAVEIDPLASLLLRAHLAAAGLADRATVVTADYRQLSLPKIAAPTLFLGNPPYVRHHALDARSKAWLVERANGIGLGASQLSGLHVHFFLATALAARSGDYGALITSAEWLDVNYGALVRRLFLRELGGKSLHFMDPTLRPFSDADTTAVVACFEVGSRPSRIGMRRIESVAALGTLDGGRAIPRERLEATPRWTPLFTARRKLPANYVELGELCRVHRGQVTGLNAVWIDGPHAEDLPGNVLFPAVTKARELFAAGLTLNDASGLRRVIDLPADLDVVPARERACVQKFLDVAKRMGAHRGFIAEHRKAWWSVGLREPAPILATYMARRPPAFVRNLAGARHINIAHGLYPRECLSPRMLDALAGYLSAATTRGDGRTYAGGLTKFEPREMERILVPPVDVLGRLANGG